MTQLFVEPIVQLALLTWLLSEAIGSAIIPLLRRKGKVKTKSDRGSGVIVRLGLVASALLCTYLATSNIAILPELFVYVGVMMMVVGVVLRQWAIWLLGGFFSTEVKIVSNQRIVKEGPYRFLRHPCYTGLLLIMLGLGLETRTWLGTIASLLLFGSAIGYRIRVEENALIREFREEYLDYAKSTKRLIPFIY